MDTLDRDALVSLSAHAGWPSISLYLPTHRSGSAKEQDPIRFRNLLRSACERLIADGMRQPEAEAFCEPINSTLSDETFWRDTEDGMAVYVAPVGTWVLKLGVPVKEAAIVGDRFYLRPLLAARGSDSRFFALALSKNGCRLFAGDAASIEQVEIQDAPASLADEIKYDEREESLQLTSFAGQQATAGAGRAVGMFHGHGGEKDVDKIQLEGYLRKVEHAVAKTVSCDKEAPLLLMGVDYEIATYRALNTCDALADEQVSGSPDKLAAHQIHASALEALSERFEARVLEELQELSDKEGSALTSRNPAEIVAAAAAGRVKTIFIDDGDGPYGLLDRTTLTVEAISADPPQILRERPSDAAGAEAGWDLVDLAAAETTLHGGEVHAFAGEGAPVRGVAAVFRY